MLDPKIKLSCETTKDLENIICQAPIKCKKLIETYKIEDLIRASNSWQDLCEKCLED